MKNSNLIVRLFNNLKTKDNRDVVITFHNIMPDDFEWFENTINFIQQKFEIMAPKDIFSKKKKSQKRVLITFDDGFKSNKKLEELILKPKKIKAIFFITTDFISLDESKAYDFVANNFYPKSTNAFFLDETKKNHFLPMNWLDLTNLIKNGHTIGCHTKTHPILSNLTIEKQKKEILESKILLEKKLNINIEHFAFPFGSPESINTQTLAIMLKEFNYNFCNVRGMINKSKKDLLYRQNISPAMPEWLIEDIINGKLNWLHYKKRLKMNSLK
tara:strand:+ start:120 stop:935 length:816 start_codon:yes stop_codon:yes gene_type:complete